MVFDLLSGRFNGRIRLHDRAGEEILLEKNIYRLDY